MLLTLEAEDVLGLKAQLIEICQGLGLAMRPSEIAPPEPIESPKKRAKKEPVKEPIDVAAQSLDNSAQPSSNGHIELGESIDQQNKTEPAPLVPKPNSSKKELVFAALKKVSTVKGMIVARNLLEEFKCARISELAEDQYPDFIQACEKLA